MWRRTDDRKVWYEWLVDVYMYLPSPSNAASTLPRASTQKAPAAAVDDGKDKGKGRIPPIVANPGPVGGTQGTASTGQKGRKVRIGGSELHSSEKEACLM